MTNEEMARELERQGYDIKRPTALEQARKMTVVADGKIYTGDIRNLPAETQRALLVKTTTEAGGSRGLVNAEIALRGVAELIQQRTEATQRRHPGESRTKSEFRVVVRFLLGFLFIGGIALFCEGSGITDYQEIGRPSFWTAIAGVVMSIVSGYLFHRAK